MKVIHKYKLSSEGKTTELKLKKGYRIVHSEFVLVEKAVFIWVEQTLAVDVKNIDVVFNVVRSGDPIPDNLIYVASAVDSYAPEAYHVLKKPDTPIPQAYLDYYPHNETNGHYQSI